MSNDLTVIYLTANELPKRWTDFQIYNLVKSAYDFPIITISRKELPLGTNLIDTEEKSYANIYRQLLRGAKMAQTKYIAVAEDDVLYTKEHFHEFRPKDDEFAYDRSRWSLFAWDGMYSLRNRISNCSLIAPRELLIEALQERFDKYPDNDFPMEFMGECGRERVERGLGITRRKMVEYYSSNPIVQLSHDYGTEERQRKHRKAHAQIKAFDIPNWGRGIDIIQKYL